MVDEEISAATPRSPVSEGEILETNKTRSDDDCFAPAPPLRSLTSTRGERVRTNIIRSKGFWGWKDKGKMAKTLRKSVKEMRRKA